MAELDFALPKGLYTHECSLAYDPIHDVCVELILGSFSSPMQAHLFRYDTTSIKTR